MRAILMCLMALFALAGREPGDDKPAAPVVLEVAKNYRQLQAATTQPVAVNPGLSALCRGVLQRDVEAARGGSGPHAYTTIKVYMNDSALEAFKASAKGFPEGAIIVKEKKGLPYTDTRDPARTLDSASTPHGVGGMVKRSPGYDPNHGDWEFFYFEDPAKIESGKIVSCVQCHDGARQDHVFGDWAKKK